MLKVQLGLSFAQARALCAAEACLEHRRPAHSHRPPRTDAGDLCSAAPVAARSGADAVASARADPAHPRRGFGPLDLAGAVARAWPHHRLQRRACVRQPPPGQRTCAARAGWPSISPTPSSPTPRRFASIAPSPASPCKAEASVVPIVVGGARHLPMSLTPQHPCAAPLAAAAADRRARAADADRTRRTRRRPERSLRRTRCSTASPKRGLRRPMPTRRCFRRSATRPCASARSGRSSRT